MLPGRSEMDRLACAVAQMNRVKVQRELMHFHGRFKLDFTEDYLNSMTLERLRHILVAAKLQQLFGN